MRPKGKWLSLEHQRYVTGKEVMVLMGFPMHRMVTNVDDNVAWMNSQNHSFEVLKFLI